MRLKIESRNVSSNIAFCKNMKENHMCTILHSNYHKEIYLSMQDIHVKTLNVQVVVTCYQVAGVTL